MTRPKKDAAEAVIDSAIEYQNALHAMFFDSGGELTPDAAIVLQHWTRNYILQPTFRAFDKQGRIDSHAAALRDGEAIFAKKIMEALATPHGQLLTLMRRLKHDRLNEQLRRGG